MNKSGCNIILACNIFVIIFIIGVMGLSRNRSLLRTDNERCAEALVSFKRQVEQSQLINQGLADAIFKEISAKHEVLVAHKLFVKVLELGDFSGVGNQLIFHASSNEDVHYIDPWGVGFLFVASSVEGGKGIELIVSSCGSNRVFENGKGDDLFVAIKLTRSLSNDRAGAL